MKMSKACWSRPDGGEMFVLILLVVMGTLQVVVGGVAAVVKALRLLAYRASGICP
jgi:hypothetical protein